MPDAHLTDLRAFFASVSDELPEILDAWGCREGWIQGEMFRWFRKHRGYSSFQVNRLKIGPRCTADYDSDNPFPLLGEIKILGSGYQSKCITGSRLSPLMSRLETPITGVDRKALSLGTWGLIPDFFRLLDFTKDSSHRAYLILIADGANDACDMANALRRIEFISAATNISFSRGLIRIWAFAPHISRQTESGAT